MMITVTSHPTSCSLFYHTHNLGIFASQESYYHCSSFWPNFRSSLKPFPVDIIYSYVSLKRHILSRHDYSLCSRHNGCEKLGWFKFQKTSQCGLGSHEYDYTLDAGRTMCVHTDGKPSTVSEHILRFNHKANEIS